MSDQPLEQDLVDFPPKPLFPVDHDDRHVCVVALPQLRTCVDVDGRRAEAMAQEHRLGFVAQMAALTGKQEHLVIHAGVQQQQRVLPARAARDRLRMWPWTMARLQATILEVCPNSVNGSGPAGFALAQILLKLSKDALRLPRAGVVFSSIAVYSP
jgi:hypothetical protein